jgi:hypothetical protein
VGRQWSEFRSSRGKPRTICTAGYACTNPRCGYHGNTDPTFHALVDDGKRGADGIQWLRCQACHHRFPRTPKTEMARTAAPQGTESEMGLAPPGRMRVVRRSTRRAFPAAYGLSGVVATPRALRAPPTRERPKHALSASEGKPHRFSGSGVSPFRYSNAITRSGIASRPSTASGSAQTITRDLVSAPRFVRFSIRQML